MSAASEKVKKLLAQAKHPNTSDTEAETFRQKAFEIMMREGLTEADVKDHDEFKVVSKTIKLKSTTWREDVILAGIVARANAAVTRYMAYDSYRGGAFINFYGEADQIEMCELMFASLILQRALAARRRPGNEKQREFASGFNVGLQTTFRRAQTTIETERGSLLPELKSRQDRINEEIGKGRTGRISQAAVGLAGLSAGLTADSGIFKRLNTVGPKAIGR